MCQFTRALFCCHWSVHWSSRYWNCEKYKRKVAGDQVSEVLKCQKSHQACPLGYTNSTYTLEAQMISIAAKDRLIVLPNSLTRFMQGICTKDRHLLAHLDPA